MIFPDLKTLTIANYLLGIFILSLHVVLFLYINMFICLLVCEIPQDKKNTQFTNKFL